MDKKTEEGIQSSLAGRGEEKGLQSIIQCHWLGLVKVEITKYRHCLGLVKRSDYTEQLYTANWLGCITGDIASSPMCRH